MNNSDNEVVLTFYLSTNWEACKTSQLSGLQTHQNPTTHEDITSPTR